MTSTRDQSDLMRWLLVSDGLPQSILSWAIRGYPTHEEMWEQPWETVSAVDAPLMMSVTTFSSMRAAAHNAWMAVYGNQRLGYMFNNLVLIRCPDGKYHWRIPDTEYRKILACETEVVEKHRARAHRR